MEENEIIFIFGKTKKKTRIPKDIEDLKNICYKEFDITNFENYSLYYDSTDSISKTEIKDEFDFGNLKPDNNNPNKNKILIKEKDLNVTQSIMYINDQNSQIRPTNFYGIQSSNLIYKNDKEELSEHNNKYSDESKSNMNSGQSRLNTQDYGGRAPSNTIKELEKEIADKYNFKESSQKSDNNKNSNSNQNSSDLNNYEVNSNIDMNTKKINAKFVENNEINNLNLENNILKETISKLENEMKNKDKLLNEKINIIQKKEEQIQGLTLKMCQKNDSEFDKAKKKDQEISSLKKENKRLDRENLNLKKECNKLLKQNNELTKEDQKLKEQIKNLKCIIIQKFREQYNTPSEYRDDSIEKALEETKGNFEDAFFKLFFDN